MCQRPLVTAPEGVNHRRTTHATPPSGANQSVAALLKYQGSEGHNETKGDDPQDREGEVGRDGPGESKASSERHEDTSELIGIQGAGPLKTRVCACAEGLHREVS